MSDTRDLDEEEFADHMRGRRGDPPNLARVVLLTRGYSAAGDGEWMAWVTVAENHPWYGEVMGDCEGVGVELLLPGESVEACTDTKNGGWMLNVFCWSEARAREMLKFMAAAAEAALLPRQDGTVVSSR